MIAPRQAPHRVPCWPLPCSPVQPHIPPAPPHGRAAPSELSARTHHVLSVLRAFVTLFWSPAAPLSQPAPRPGCRPDFCSLCNFYFGCHLVCGSPRYPRQICGALFMPPLPVQIHLSKSKSHWAGAFLHDCQPLDFKVLVNQAKDVLVHPYTPVHSPGPEAVSSL